MRYAVLLAALALIVPACAGDTEGDPSTTPPENTPKTNTPEKPDPKPDVDPGPEVATETVVLEVSGMT
jgi:hypothetical protein